MIRFANFITLTNRKSINSPNRFFRKKVIIGKNVIPNKTSNEKIMKLTRLCLIICLP